MMGQLGFLGNNTGATRVGEFRDRILLSYVYPKFFHMDNMLMGITAKALLNELSIEAAAHYHSAQLRKNMWTYRLGLILLEKLKVDAVNIVFSNCLYHKVKELRVAKGA